MILRFSSILLCFIFLIGCTHTVRRTGYTFDDSKAQTDCDVSFVHDEAVDSSKNKILGKVRVGDSGFSFACGEDDAVKLFKREACNVGADIVDIIEEHRPDFWSSCYRATALLIKKSEITDNQIPIRDQGYSNDSSTVAQRVNKDHKRNASIIVGGINWWYSGRFSCRDYNCYYAALRVRGFFRAI